MECILHTTVEVSARVLGRAELHVLLLAVGTWIEFVEDGNTVYHLYNPAVKLVRMCSIRNNFKYSCMSC